MVDATFGCTPAVAYYRHIVYVEVWYLSGCRSLAPWCMLKSYCRWLVRGGVEVGCSHRLRAGAGAVSVRRSPVAAVVDATLRFTPVRAYDRHVVYVKVLYLPGARRRNSLCYKILAGGCFSAVFKLPFSIGCMPEEGARRLAASGVEVVVVVGHSLVR